MWFACTVVQVTPGKLTIAFDDWAGAILERQMHLKNGSQYFAATIQEQF